MQDGAGVPDLAAGVAEPRRFGQPASPAVLHDRPRRRCVRCAGAAAPVQGRHEVGGLTGLQRQFQVQLVVPVVPQHPGVGSAGPAERAAAYPAPPAAAVVQAQVPHAQAAVVRAQAQPDADRRRAVQGGDLAQQYCAVRRAGQGQGVAAVQVAVLGGPPVAPHPRAVRVVPSPDVPSLGLDPVGAGPADRRAGQRRAVPARGAQPGDLALRPDQGAALAVGERRVVPQHARAVQHLGSLSQAGGLT